MSTHSPWRIWWDLIGAEGGRRLIIYRIKTSLIHVVRRHGLSWTLACPMNSIESMNTIAIRPN